MNEMVFGINIMDIWWTLVGLALTGVGLGFVKGYFIFKRMRWNKGNKQGVKTK